MMRSRVFREGAAGLLILTGVLAFAGLFVWIYNLRFREAGYTFTTLFEDAGGLTRGGTVLLRGVRVGQITTIEPGIDTVKVVVGIDRSSTVIPSEAEFLATQIGLIGETVLEIVPALNVDSALTETSTPLSGDCNQAAIVCDGSQVAGEVGVNYADVIEKMDRLAERLDNDELFGSIDTVATGIGEVTASISALSNKIQRDFDFNAINDAARSVQSIGTTVADVGGTVEDVGRSIQTTSDNLNALVEANKDTLNSTIADFATLSSDLQEITTALKPILADAEFAANVRSISANAAEAATKANEAAENIRVLSEGVSDPDTIASLRATLDSARATFENAQKITADLDNLTGDPMFRENLRDLVEGLSSLVSTLPELESQPAIASDPALPDYASSLPASHDSQQTSNRSL
ncbi:MAG: MlaD family protein [Cyanobacteria bacterium J06642_2]